MPIAQPTFPATGRFETVTQEMVEGGLALRDHPARSATTIDGWSSIFFGLPFFLIGCFIELAALNVLPAHGRHAPEWVIGLVGSFFLLAGLFLLTHGAATLVRRARYRREAALHPGQSWIADYTWNARGAGYSEFHVMVGRICFALFWSAFLVPFFWIGLRGVWPFLAGALFFALIGVYIWYRAALSVVGLLRYGKSFLGYDGFPFFLGGQLGAHLEAPRGLGEFEELTLTFRCVAERYLTGGAGPNRSSQVACFELYKDAVTFSREQLAGYSGGVIPVQFAIPANQPQTNLIGTPPTYWEIEACGKCSGVNYQAYFLVPVYAAA